MSAFTIFPKEIWVLILAPLNLRSRENLRRSCKLLRQLIDESPLEYYFFCAAKIGFAHLAYPVYADTRGLNPRRNDPPRQVSQRQVVRVAFSAQGQLNTAVAVSHYHLTPDFMWTDQWEKTPQDLNTPWKGSSIQLSAGKDIDYETRLISRWSPAGPPRMGGCFARGPVGVLLFDLRCTATYHEVLEVIIERRNEIKML